MLHAVRSAEKFLLPSDSQGPKGRIEFRRVNKHLLFSHFARLLLTCLPNKVDVTSSLTTTRRDSLVTPGETHPNKGKHANDIVKRAANQKL